MSQSAIGRAALILTTNAAGLRAGLAAESGHLKKWADDTGKAITARLGGAGLLAGLTAARGRVAGAAAGIVGSVLTIRSAVETLDDVARAGAAARAFGLTAEQFTGMAGLAKSVGEDTREFIESLVTLGKVAAEGAAGRGAVAVQFFKDLNLNAGEFAALRLDQQFFKVFEAIARVEDPAARVRALMVAFGEDGGKYLIPLLSRSPAQLRELAAGFEVSGRQVAAATKAAEAFARAQASIQQLWRRIVVAAAPVLEFLARELRHTIGLFGTMEQTGTKALASILKVTARLIDATKALGAATLLATGYRLKFAAAEIGFKTASALASTGVGAAVAVPAGALAAGLWEASGIGREVRTAGNVLTGAGEKLWRDVGGATARADAFLKEFEARKDGPKQPAAFSALGAAAADLKAAAVHLKQFDNAALLRGTSAEVSARLRHDLGGQTAQQRLLDEQKRANGHLGRIDTGIRALNDKPPPAGLLAL